MGNVHKEAHHLKTPEQLYRTLLKFEVPNRVAGKIATHEGHHAAAHKRAEGIDGKGVKASGDFGGSVDSNGYYYRVSAYYKPSNWGELSFPDIEAMALAPTDPSGPDMDIARTARANGIRQEERDRVDRIYLRNEIENRMDDMVKHGKELTYEELLLNYGNLIERNEDFVEKMLDKAKENALLRKKEEEKIGVEIKPVLGTILAEEDLDLLHGQPDKEKETYLEENNESETDDINSGSVGISDGEDQKEKEIVGIGLIYKAKQTEGIVN